MLAKYSLLLSFVMILSFCGMVNKLPHLQPGENEDMFYTRKYRSLIYNGNNISGHYGTQLIRC